MYPRLAGLPTSEEPCCAPIRLELLVAPVAAHRPPTRPLSPFRCCLSDLPPAPAPRVSFSVLFPPPPPPPAPAPPPPAPRGRGGGPGGAPRAGGVRGLP